jgi:hypothetical protein
MDYGFGMIESQNGESIRFYEPRYQLREELNNFTIGEDPMKERRQK